MKNNLKPVDEIAIRPSQVSAILDLQNELLVDDPTTRSYYNLRVVAIALLRSFQGDIELNIADLDYWQGEE